MKPLIAKYLGGLPSINRKETFKDNKMDIRKGEIKNVFAKAQETPMATIMFLYSGTCKYDLRNNVLLSFLDQALDLVYTAEIREKEGGTYGVSCNGSLGKYPKEELVLQIVFQTDPAKKDKLSAVVVEQLHKMAKEGPSAEHMQKIKEYMLKKYKDAQKENGYWLNNMDEYLYTGVDNTKDYEKLVNSITAKEVQDFLAKLLKQNSEIQVIMTVPVMYSREGLDSKGIISDLQGPVLTAPSTAQNAEYFSTVVNFDYRVHPNWNLYLKGAYERAGIYKANGHFEKGLYRTTWNAQACVEYFPMRNSELLIFAHLLYKGHHLTRRAQALGSTSPDTQRISVGLVYSIPVF